LSNVKSDRIGLRIDYMADLLPCHVSSLGKALDAIERAAEFSRNVTTLHVVHGGGAA